MSDEPVTPSTPRQRVVAMIESRASAVGRFELTDARLVRGRTIAVIAATVIGMVLALFAFVDNFSGAGDVVLPRIEVPSVKGFDLAATHKTLEDLGFVVDVKFQPNEVVPKGQVFTQEPPSRAKAEQGSIISVLASDGPVGVTAPNVVGQQVADATLSLQASGIRVEVTAVTDEQVRSGEVIRTAPSPGQRVIDATLHLQVSSGPAPRIVPQVIGKPIEVALAALGHDGLNIGDIQRTFRADLAPGTVFGVDPPAGTGLPRNTPVSLQVAGPEVTVLVPYLVALRQTSAAAVLRTAGLAMTVVTTPVAGGDPNDGKVIAQGFAPQTKVKAGTAVEVTVAVAAGVPQTTPPGG